MKKLSVPKIEGGLYLTSPYTFLLQWHFFLLSIFSNDQVPFCICWRQLSIWGGKIGLQPSSHNLCFFQMGSDAEWHTIQGSHGLLESFCSDMPF